MSIGSIEISEAFSSDETTWKDGLLRTAFWAATYLTDPICKSHEYFRRVQIVDALHPLEWKVTRLARQFFLSVFLVGFATLGVFTAPPGTALRALGVHLQDRPFLFEKGDAPEKTLPPERSFTLLSWNVCCVAGGYPISDGGVVPWADRIDALAQKIIQTNADLNCLYEVFDVKSALKLSDKLKEAGYSHFYFNIGPKAVGASSGIFVASKYGLTNPEFTPFPQEMLIGRTKHASKGIFSFDLESQGSAFARVVATHLQHSEEPAYPTPDEIAARASQMEMLIKQTEAVKDRCLLALGDLNLDDAELQASTWSSLFEKKDLYSDKTWGGDAFCARLTGKRVSEPLNLDHTMCLKGSVQSMSTELIETGYDAEFFSADALSDHRGLLTKIVLDTLLH